MYTHFEVTVALEISQQLFLPLLEGLLLTSDLMNLGIVEGLATIETHVGILRLNRAVLDLCYS